MTLKTTLANTALVCLSIGVSLLLSEAVARMFLSPADYLSVEMVAHPVLGAVPSAGNRSGFDSWGFRNSAVPEKVDIVAIGDSHTYGNTARLEDSWPKVLERLSGKSVYNMGMGGYGPNQYAHLLTQALKLKPRLVLCGLYMGDDFENAFLITYGLDHWARLRQMPISPAVFDIWEVGGAPLVWHKGLRNWFARHSVAYQVTFHGPLMGLVQGEFQIRNATKLDPSAASLEVPEGNILEAFHPGGPLRNLDQNSQPVREGMRITFELLKEMKDRCERQQVRLAVVIIPVKEAVFDRYFASRPSLPMVHTLTQVVSNEQAARNQAIQFLEQNGIACVDALPALRKSAAHRLYARSAADMHPSANGYRVIGEAVAACLSGLLTSSRGQQQPSRHLPNRSLALREFCDRF